MALSQFDAAIKSNSRHVGAMMELVTLGELVGRPNWAVR